MVLQQYNIDGGVLAVEVEGQGPLVICAPALGDTRDSYEPLAKALISQGYCVARMDARGHGDSSATFKHYGDAAAADDFIFLAENLNRGPAIFAGDSFSAGGAVIAAGKRPDLVMGLMLFAPFLRNPVSDFVRISMRAMFWRPWGPAIWKMYSATLWPGLGDKAKERAALSKASLTRPNRWAAFQATFAGADHSLVAPWIELVRAPVLVVMGEKDPDWSNPEVEADWVASNFPGATKVMVPESGHAPMLERPELVSKEALSFLGKVRAGDSTSTTTTTA